MEPNEQSVQAVPTPAVVVAPVAPVAKKPDFHLIVVHPFDDYQRGQKIEGADVIAAMKDHHLNHHCRKVSPQ